MSAGLIVLPTTLVSGLVMGFSAAGDQTALYSQAPADQLGTASGLLRTFGYVGSIASSAITGIVFHRRTRSAGEAAHRQVNPQSQPEQKQRLPPPPGSRRWLRRSLSPRSSGPRWAQRGSGRGR